MNYNESNLIKKDAVEINLQQIQAVCFCTHFMAFSKQSVKGSVMAIYRVYSDESTFTKMSKEKVKELLINGHFVFQNNIQYLNSCWISFHKKNDEYISNKFGLMMKFGNYKHPSCIFTHIWNFSQNLLYYILSRIDFEILKDVEFFSECIDSMLDAILSSHADDIINRKYFCNEECDVYQYKEKEDFIKIKKI